MPLPNSFKRCRAKAKRSQQQCLNPAAYGCATCRMHGARRPESIKRGAKHPMFKHGHSTIEAIEERKSAFKFLRNIELLMDACGIGSGPRLRGRKS